MFTEDIAEKILMNPLREGADELYVAASYATHTMLSWFLTNLELHQHQTLRIAMMVGMVPYIVVQLSRQKSKLFIMN